ncbi:MAG: hypothetical protein J5709_08325 [Bacteroidales bacterium]|nr:hypothetical protein [Bacteroidales bacterium]
MRKTLVLLASVAFALTMLTSCNSGTSTNTGSGSDQSNGKTLTDGQWSIDFLGDRNTYQFNDDKTGKYISSNEDECYDFTYDIVGDSIFISQVSDAIFDMGPDKYAYKISGNQLNLKGGYFGMSDMTYKWEKRK